jgi:peptidoglycan/LPS O-acetylase OafA/YrhL
MPAAGRLESLTALRWFAAFVVFGKHAFSGGRLSHLVNQGVVGVSFFFILSGFVLTWSYRDGDRTGAFYQRRFARIYPAFLVSVAIGAIVNHGTVTPLHLLLVVTMLQDWSHNSAVYFSVSVVCWSLGCEAFFYLLFPFVIRPLRRLTPHRRRLLLVLVLAASLAVQLGIHSPSQNHGTGFWLMYIFPPVRFLEFVAGMILALEVRDGTRLRISLRSAVAIAVAAYLAAGFVPIYAMWLAVTLLPFTLLIFTAATADVDGARSWLRTPILIKLGEISYCFYLLHQLILIASGRLANWAGVPYSATKFAIPDLIVSVIAAYLLYRFVERPFERRLRPGRPRSPGSQPIRAAGEDPPTVAEIPAGVA